MAGRPMAASYSSKEIQRRTQANVKVLNRHWDELWATPWMAVVLRCRNG